MWVAATKDDLRSWSKNLTLDEQTAIASATRSSAATATAFLSHSSKDKDLTLGAIRILKNHGASVYIDEIDTSLPSQTNLETAKQLKGRIKSCRKFILLATPNSKESRWVPWELGIADGYKDIWNLAIFPASDTFCHDEWTNWEYIGLYDKIVYGDLKSYSNKVWMVLDERNNTATELSKWLQN
jgi:TIR domain